MKKKKYMFTLNAIRLMAIYMHDKQIYGGISLNPFCKSSLPSWIRSCPGTHLRCGILGHAPVARCPFSNCIHLKASPDTHYLCTKGGSLPLF